MGFIVIVLVLLLSLSLVIVFRQLGDEYSEDGTCVTQIMAHAAAVSFTNELVAPKITCPTHQRVVAADKANQAIAEEMQRCWALWREGKQQLFGEQEGVYCHVCSTVTVERAEPISGLGPYLDTQMANKEQTYSQFILGRQSGTYFTGTVSSSVNDFPAGKPIGVIFYYAKGKHWYEVLQTKVIGEPGIGTTVGIVVGVAVTSGASIPVVVLGGVAGGAAGGAGSIASRPDASYQAVVVAKPLTTEEIGKLGCTYAPVSN